MRPIVVVSLLSLIACGSTAGSDAEPSVTSTPTEPTALDERSDISVGELASRKEAKADLVLVDVRTPAEYAGGHVPGAANIPLSDLDPTAPPFTTHDRDQEIYVICQSGRRSAAAADQLAAAGFKAVNVEGGTGAWQAAGHPVE